MKHKMAAFVLLACLVASLALAQKHPLDSSHSFEEAYSAVWGRATLREVQDWLKAGGEANAKGRDNITALMWAAYSNQNPAIINALVKAGVDIEAREDAEDWTALHWAASQNPNPEVVKALIEAGADIDAQDADGQTALMLAAELNPGMIVTLLEAGADANIPNQFDMTSLMAAVQNPDVTPAMVTALLNAGADVKVKNLMDKTALDYATDNRALEGTEALRQLEVATR